MSSTNVQEPDRSAVDQIIDAWEKCERHEALWPAERFRLWMKLKNMNYAQIEEVVSRHFGLKRT